MSHKGLKWPCVHHKLINILLSHSGQKQSQVTDLILIMCEKSPFSKTKVNGGHV